MNLAHEAVAGVNTDGAGFRSLSARAACCREEWLPDAQALRLSRDISRVPEVASEVEGIELLDPARQQEEENRHDGAGQ